MHGLIYLITNTVNGRLYVGQTTMPLNLRWNAHKCAALTNARHTISKAIRKYGPESFTISPICTANTREELNHVEKLCIVLMNSLAPNGYNRSPGGSRAPEITEQTRLKMSEVQKGKKHTAETIQKRATALRALGRKVTQAHKDAIARANKGISRSFFSEKTREKLSAAGTGRTHTQQAKHKMSTSWTPERRAAMAASKAEWWAAKRQNVV